MSVEAKIEEFVLAPSDPAWVDERNRDEYYRASAFAYFWAIYGFLGIAIFAAWQGAVGAALAAVLVPGLIQIGALQRYCTRHGVSFYRIAAGFNKGKRRIFGVVTLVPLYLAVGVIVSVRIGFLDGDAATLAGGLVGAICGLGIGWAVYLVAKRRPEEPSEPDDVFE